MRRWLTLALPALLLAPGCFLAHGLDGPGGAGPIDAGSRPVDAGAVLGDAGVCESFLPSRGELMCPAFVSVGAPVVVSIAHAPSGCCTAAGARAVLEPRGARGFEITTSWESCECCELCECVTEPVTERFDLGSFDAGLVTVVVTDGQRCEIEVRESDCASIDAPEAHAPMAVAVGDPIPVLLRSEEPHGCGCRPEPGTYFGRKGERAVGIEICDCSSSDPCVDPGYETTALHDATDVIGTATLSVIGGPPQSIEIVDPASCHEGPEVLGLRLAAPERERLLQSDPIGYWAVLELSDWYCCASPLSLVQSDRSSAFTVELTPRSCVAFDCDCEPVTPTRWEHWHHLGALEPGVHTVTAGAHELRFEVTR